MSNSPISATATPVENSMPFASSFQFSPQYSPPSSGILDGIVSAPTPIFDTAMQGTPSETYPGIFDAPVEQYPLLNGSDWSLPFESYVGMNIDFPGDASGIGSSPINQSGADSCDWTQFIQTTPTQVPTPEALAETLSSVQLEGPATIINNFDATPQVQSYEPVNTEHATKNPASGRQPKKRNNRSVSAPYTERPSGRRKAAVNVPAFVEDDQKRTDAFSERSKRFLRTAKNLSSACDPFVLVYCSRPESISDHRGKAKSFVSPQLEQALADIGKSHLIDELHIAL
ncbi:hypothetical protein VNI00_003474, partial [Paramarasmius palmivorus]